MKKIRNCSGFSLVEMLVAVAILVILIVGMDAGINAGVRAYGDAVFESNSAALSGILNTAVGDVLRYSENVRVNPAVRDPKLLGFKDIDDRILPPDQVGFVFSSYEYGVRNGYFYVGTNGEDHRNVIQIRDLQNSHIKAVRNLVNTGSYPDLEVRDFHVNYVLPDEAAGEPGNYFTVSYDIYDTEKDTRVPRHVDYTVRLLNPAD